MTYRKIETIGELNKKTLAQATGTEVKKTGHVANAENEETRKKQKENSQLKNKISKAEEEISKLEKEIKSIDDQLQDPVKYQELVKAPDFFKNYEAKKTKLEEKMKEWEELNDQL